MLTSTSQPVSDAEPIGTAMPGDAVALSDLYDRHAPDAFRLACAVCADERAAARAVQHAFTAIARSRVGDGPRGDAAAWLLGLVHRQALAEVRHGHSAPGPLAALPDGQAEIIALACFGSFSYREIAKQLDVPPCAVKHLMRTALHGLLPARQAFAGAGGEVTYHHSSAPQLVIDLEHRDRTATITIDGELDIATRDRVLDTLGEAERLGAANCVLDLRGLTFIDVGGARLLAQEAARTEADGCALLVIPPVCGAAARMMQMVCPQIA